MQGFNTVYEAGANLLGQINENMCYDEDFQRTPRNGTFLPLILVRSNENRHPSVLPVNHSCIVDSDEEFHEATPSSRYLLQPRLGPLQVIQTRVLFAIVQEIPTNLPTLWGNLRPLGPIGPLQTFDDDEMRTISNKMFSILAYGENLFTFDYTSIAFSVNYRGETLMFNGK